MLAKRYNCSPATISLWRSGARKPREGARILIRQDLGIPECDWDAAPADPVALPESSDLLGALEVAHGEADAATAEREADRVLGLIRRCSHDIAAQPDASPDRVRQLSALTTMVKQLGELTGAGLVLSERAILASPNLKIITDRIVGALEAYPDALQAVVDALRGEVPHEQKTD